MRWVVPFPTGRGTVSFRTTQVSLVLSSPHLPHFNYWLQQQNEIEERKKEEWKWKFERNWKSWIWLIGEKPWRGKKNWDHRSHLGVEDWWDSQALQWSSMWSSPFLSLWYSNSFFCLGIWSFWLESMDGSRQCKRK